MLYFERKCSHYVENPQIFLSEFVENPQIFFGKYVEIPQISIIFYAKKRTAQSDSPAAFPHKFGYFFSFV